MKTLVVAKDFSRYPAGRFRIDGSHTGEKFREDFLIPMLQVDLVTVDLDGARGYGSSFLEEAFGGLIRTGKFSFTQLREKLTITSTKPSLRAEVWRYIEDAAALEISQHH